MREYERVTDYSQFLLSYNHIYFFYLFIQKTKKNKNILHVL